MKEKKYKLTDETIEVDGRTLHRIEALKDFGLIRKGEKGGFIESEKNLSQEGDCWVGEKAKVFENAQVYENAHVYGNAKVCGNASMYGEALTVNEVQVYDNAQVYGNVLLWGNVKVYGKTKLSGKITIANAEICNSKFVILK